MTRPLACSRAATGERGDGLLEPVMGWFVAKIDNLDSSDCYAVDLLVYDLAGNPIQRWSPF